jgi:tetratricopeptide (TPR) repeat protein
MLFATGVVVVVWFVSRRSQERELQRIFEFYIAADAILRGEDRKWFGFEIAEVIEEGERALDVIPDSPPLHYFALGALYHRLGKFDTSVEYLSKVVEDDLWGEQRRMAPSPQLRRYVQMLRQLEFEPSRAPMVLGAIKSLERAREKYASQLLLDGRNSSVEALNAAETSGHSTGNSGKETNSVPTAAHEVSPPPSIVQVLHDVYDNVGDDQKPN